MPKRNLVQEGRELQKKFKESVDKSDITRISKARKDIKDVLADLEEMYEIAKRVDELLKQKKDDGTPRRIAYQAIQRLRQLFGSRKRDIESSIRTVESSIKDALY